MIEPSSTCVCGTQAWYDEQGVHLRLGHPVRASIRRDRTLYAPTGMRTPLRRPGHRHRFGGAPTFRSHRDPSACPSLRTLEDSRAAARRRCIPGAPPRGRWSRVHRPGDRGHRPALGLDVTVVEYCRHPTEPGVRRPRSAIWSDTTARDATASTSVGRLPAEMQAGVAIHPRFADGLTLPADVVVTGVGAAPQTAWLDGESGSRLATVFAARARPVPPASRASSPPETSPSGTTPLRRGHARRALDQRRRTGPCTPPERLLGERQAFESVPYFWTDQFDAKLRCVGRRIRRTTTSSSTSRTRSLRRRLRPRTDSAGRVCVNAPRQLAHTATRHRASAPLVGTGEPPATQRPPSPPRSTTPGPAPASNRRYTMTPVVRRSPTADALSHHRTLPAGRGLVAADHAPARPGRGRRRRPLRVCSHRCAHRRHHHRRRGVAAGMEPHRAGSRGPGRGRARARATSPPPAAPCCARAATAATRSSSSARRPAPRTSRTTPAARTSRRRLDLTDGLIERIEVPFEGIDDGGLHRPARQLRQAPADRVCSLAAPTPGPRSCTSWAGPSSPPATSTWSWSTPRAGAAPALQAAVQPPGLRSAGQGGAGLPGGARRRRRRPYRPGRCELRRLLRARGRRVRTPGQGRRRVVRHVEHPHRLLRVLPAAAGAVAVADRVEGRRGGT